MTKHEDKITFRYEPNNGGTTAEGILANVNIEGMAGYTVGIPAVGDDRKAHVVALLRRLADVMEAERRF